MSTTPLAERHEQRPDGPSEAEPARRGRVALGVVAGVAVVAAAWFALDGAESSGDAEQAAGATVDAAGPSPAPIEVTVAGLRQGDVLGTDALAALDVVVTAPDAASLEISLDGEPLPAATDDEPLPTTTDDEPPPTTDDEPPPTTDDEPAVEDALVDLPDGPHVLEVVATAEDDRSATTTIEFAIDTAAPTVSLPDVVEAASPGGPLVVVVATEGATTVEAPGGVVETATDGTATVTFDSRPSTVAVTAADEAGNETTAEAPVVLSFPGGRAVHTTPSAWRYAPKREPIIELLEAGRIDAVQMDIKDELGDVAWDTDVQLADDVGAEDFNRSFDMAEAIRTIHEHDARVIGRLTVYRDHRLAQWAWENGRRDMVVQATDGTPYAGRYGDYAFTNFAHPDVQQYNLDIALEAAELGFDDILYDYIRRPDGAIDELVVPGLGDRTPEEAVVEVMATAYPLLHERGAWVGASVFGIAIDRPTQMAQDIPMMAEHVDYVAPMVYPNHWNPGEYDVPDPEQAPYDIVERSLTDFQEVLEPTGTALMPWLQDFGGYGEAEVRAQIDATEAVTGERSFLLWASSATYTEAALDPIPGRGG